MPGRHRPGGLWLPALPPHPALHFEPGRQHSPGVPGAPGTHLGQPPAPTAGGTTAQQQPAWGARGPHNQHPAAAVVTGSSRHPWSPRGAVPVPRSRDPPSPAGATGGDTPTPTPAPPAPQPTPKRNPPCHKHALARHRGRRAARHEAMPQATPTAPRQRTGRGSHRPQCRPHPGTGAPAASAFKKRWGKAHPGGCGTAESAPTDSAARRHCRGASGIFIGPRAPALLGPTVARGWARARSAGLPPPTAAAGSRGSLGGGSGPREAIAAPQRRCRSAAPLRGPDSPLSSAWKEPQRREPAPAAPAPSAPARNNLPGQHVPRGQPERDRAPRVPSAAGMPERARAAGRAQSPPRGRQPSAGDAAGSSPAPRSPTAWPVTAGGTRTPGPGEDRQEAGTRHITRRRWAEELPRQEGNNSSH